MRITAAVAEQLLLLHGDPDLAGDLAAALDRLGRDVAVAVPSCLTVSIALLVRTTRSASARPPAPPNRPRCSPPWPYRCPPAQSATC